MGFINTYSILNSSRYFSKERTIQVLPFIEDMELTFVDVHTSINGDKWEYSGRTSSNYHGIVISDFNIDEFQNSFRILNLYGFENLKSANDTEFENLNLLCKINEEFINFKNINVVDEQDNIYSISYLTRGHYQTPIQEHFSGEKIFMFKFPEQVSDLKIPDKENFLIKLIGVRQGIQPKQLEIDLCQPIPYSYYHKNKHIENITDLFNERIGITNNLSWDWTGWYSGAGILSGNLQNPCNDRLVNGVYQIKIVGEDKKYEKKTPYFSHDTNVTTTYKVRVIMEDLYYSDWVELEVIV